MFNNYKPLSGSLVYVGVNIMGHILPPLSHILILSSPTLKGSEKYSNAVPVQAPNPTPDQFPGLHLAS
jgi:hypothetical protein